MTDFSVNCTRKPMPEHLRALIVILFLSTAFFAFAGRPAADIIERVDFTRRRNVWFGLTLVAFLAHSVWLYLFIATPMLIYANRQEKTPPALFFFVLLALPMATISIPGFGLINYLLTLTHARILALLILLPAFFTLIRQSDTLAFGRTTPDKALAAYLLLTAILFLRETSVTDTLRQALYLVLDVFLPYFVISRSLKNLQAFMDTFLSLILAIMVLALIAVFEMYNHWLLYKPLLNALGLGGGMTGYLARDNMLRVMASAGHPIVLGYLMVVGMGCYLFMQRKIKQKWVRRLGMGLLVAGLIAPLSRGPWVGGAVLFFIFIATGRNAALRLISLALVGMLALPLITMLPGGERVINLLPFVGSTETENVDYRKDLLTNSLIVIQRNPWFGSVNYIETPEMQAMMQGQGIIDIVNSYIGVALESGFVGVGLFIGFFASVVIGVYRAMRLLPDRDGDEHLLGRALLATLLAILVIIFTVSSISFISIVYWSVAGLGVAYTQMVRKHAATH